jgi:hypothetical protein
LNVVVVIAGLIETIKASQLLVLPLEKWKDLADKEALIFEEGTAAKTAAR